MTCLLQLAGKGASVSTNSRNELPYRLRQQSLLGEFSRSALQTRDFRQILQRATELSAQGLEAPFAKVLEYLPDENRLLVRSGVGWAPGATDNASLGADVESPAGLRDSAQGVRQLADEVQGRATTAGAQDALSAPRPKSCP